MTFRIFPEENLGATNLNNCLNKLSLTQCLNLVRTLQDRSITFSKGKYDAWGEAYIDSTGRLDAVDINYTSAIFSSNKYTCDTNVSASSPFVVIEATSLTETDFNINNCKCFKIATGKWIVYCTSGSVEVQRAQIYKTLFYGTDGSNARAKTTYITGITALKTSVSRDVGKRASYLSVSVGAGTAPTYCTATFSDTTNNTSCSSWSYLTQYGGSAGGAENRWEVPSGSILNTLSGSPSTTKTSDETGTDLHATDEINNPATARVMVNTGVGASATSLAFILHYGSASYSGGTSINFFTTHNVPAMTATTETLSDYTNLVVHTIPANTFKSTIKNLFAATLIADYESGIDIQVKLKNASEDSGFMSIFDASSNVKWNTFTPFTTEPTQLIIKLVPKSSSPTTGYPSIYGFGSMGDI